ncbi:MAG: HPr kinase/phosphorylase [Burkholderiales bacterium]|nr:HPr kinase/phosphorylase [Burkholderiales bacterium]MCW5574691.1 HPr kinase/phosphorylase [Burkholderiales bacterium]
MPKVSITRLFEGTREKLQLTWVAGQAGAGKGIDSELTKDSSKGLVGHLNFIHPNLIQVLGDSEVDYLGSLPATECRAMLEKAAIRELACFIVAGGNPVPAALAEVAEFTQTPLFSSPIPSVELMWIMRPHLARELAESSTTHGVFLDVLGVGVLLTGDSGVGKSELGLELISRGSGLIADDIVELYRLGPESIEGRCPLMLRDFLEVRGLGVLNIRTIFGEAALRPRKNVKLIVHLERPRSTDPTHIERLPLKPGTESLMGVEIRKVTIPVAAGRNLAVLTEAAVRSYVLQMRGMDSTREFIERQERAMNNTDA